jgi:hypothetical protein
MTPTHSYDLPLERAIVLALYERQMSTSELRKRFGCRVRGAIQGLVRYGSVEKVGDRFVRTAITSGNDLYENVWSLTDGGMIRADKLQRR